MWKENINNAFKYVFLAAGSSLKGESDFKKYEKARKLKVRAVPIQRQPCSCLTCCDSSITSMAFAQSTKAN